MFFSISSSGLEIICDYFNHTIFPCGVNVFELIDREVVDHACPCRSKYYSLVIIGYFIEANLILQFVDIS
jgi:hypothetical protein